MKSGKKYSFTAIEMLVVLGIVGVLSMAIIISDQSNRSRSNLLNAAKKMALDIRKVQNAAINSAAEELSGEVPCGHGIKFSNGAGSNLYLSFYENMSVPGGVCATNKIFGAVNAGEIEFEKSREDFNNQKIKINSIEVDDVLSETVSLFFSPPDPIFYIEGNTGKTLEVVLKVEGKNCPSDFCKTIRVNSFGQASIE